LAAQSAACRPRLVLHGRTCISESCHKETIDMGIKELAAKVAAAHPEIAAAQINKVLRTALGALSAELDSAADGALKLAPLGSFHVSTKPAKGEEGGEPKRRVTLKLAKARDPEAKAARAANKPGGADRVAERAEKKAARQAGKAVKQATRQASKAAKPGKATKPA
jgi:nucleoid DNA-binding protein